MIVDLKPRVVGPQIDFSPRRFVQKHARLQFPYSLLFEMLLYELERDSGVNDIFNQQDVTILQLKFRRKMQVNGSRALGSSRVTSDLDEVQPQGKGEPPEQVGREDQRSFQHGNDINISAAVITIDLVGEPVDPFLNLGFTKKRGRFKHPFSLQFGATFLFCPLLCNHG